ncbi:MULTISPECIES: 3-oxoacyl-ACP synthase III family protein [Streptomyces]|uniref:3-oxoacyl-ACP synthase n=1 Tax=Streptomyces dengpaensis TaxID=2049881 RepID=A0ABN5HYG2_9ACTN|nr:MULTISPECIES: 3-oxoacyl-ACP synthase III family protein [Streptomyces]AVH55798.1 3-oxoacyl-ACP synthase [Streptomyces dengpaensis]PIB12053.1 3-oxoacyl-ACP synthase [Streptomyces sp. HG99]
MNGPRTSVPHIAGTGAALPGDPVDNESLARLLGASARWIEDFTGNQARHFATDLATGDSSLTLTDLCEEAADAALADAGVDPGEIGFIVLGTATPDHLMPATVNLVADRLGIDQVPTYQLQSGCAGAIQALDTGCRLLRDADADDDLTGLVIGGDICNKHFALQQDFQRLPPNQLVNYMLFGDGAAAAVLSRRPRGHAVAVRRVLQRFVGLGRPPGQVIEWFGAADRDDGRPPAGEDYKAIEEYVPQLAEEIVRELAESVGWSLGELHHLLPPQLSGRMTRHIVERLDVPAHEVSCVATTGNNGNALPLLQLDRLMPLMREGERALCAAVESSKWLKGGLALEKVPVGADAA